MDADFLGRIQAPDRRRRPDLPKLVLPSDREQPSIGTPERVNGGRGLKFGISPRTRRQAKAVLRRRLSWFFRENGCGRNGVHAARANQSAVRRRMRSWRAACSRARATFSSTSSGNTSKGNGEAQASEAASSAAHRSRDRTVSEPARARCARRSRSFNSLSMARCSARVSPRGRTLKRMGRAKCAVSRFTDSFIDFTSIPGPAGPADKKPRNAGVLRGGGNVATSLHVPGSTPATRHSPPGVTRCPGAV